MEENREPRREGAMETLRAIDQATARIDALIERAGGPMVICKNVQESDAVKRESRMLMLYDVADYRYDGDLLAYPVVLADMIDRLEAALYNTLNERDQLKRDLHDAVTYDWVLRPCHFCAHLEEPTNETPCGTCLRHKGKPGFEWRGVPDKEE